MSTSLNQTALLPVTWCREGGCFTSSFKSVPLQTLLQGHGAKSWCQTWSMRIGL